MKLLVTVFSALILFSSTHADAPLEKTGTYKTTADSVQGGKFTDGKDLRNIRWGVNEGFERIVLDIHYGSSYKKGPPAEVPCRYKVKYEYYPFRFTVEMSGIRAVNAEFGPLEKSTLVRETYRIPYLDDSGMKFAVSLKKPVEYEIFELHDPARIVLDIRQNASPQDLPAVYSVRTSADLGYEQLGHIEEQLIGSGSKNTRIIKTPEGMFVEEGYYPTRERAQERLKMISPKVEGKVEFFIEKRDSGFPQE
ncbi:MAG: hypothetical protein ACOCW1_03535 [Chitinispirillaceae bacterium]